MDKAPDAMMAYLGGQISIVNISKTYFIDKPLMLISTWDGDEHSLAHAVNEFKDHEQNNFEKTRQDFDKKIAKLMNDYDFECFYHQRGIGNFSGELPPKYNKILNHIEGRKIINISPRMMELFQE